MSTTSADPVPHTAAEHEHREGCGHATVEHRDHIDAAHDGHRG
ncbi:zinc transporter permease [Cellulomonas fimi]|uniref:Zinc transporter permease n=1 Tax=Cellulomonas fimi TaxID=1708 RepID=A0A7Y0LXU8_CELFI|nr:zinc transporter permease [Cellulomonas fimi]NMR20247.1 zinc transporter permease [Cellulomonas fimi]